MPVSAIFGIFAVMKRENLKVVIVNRSDRTGGAAMVSLRLVRALRRAGVDARMLVAEKLGDEPYVAAIASRRRMLLPFLEERLRIFIANGFDRSTLFKIDTASDGIDISRHPWIRGADVICLNWINQGMLSLRGIRRLCAMGKPVVWTMHDMWCMTGICHHAGDCARYLTPGQCGECPLLGRHSSEKDLSFKTFRRKQKLYAGAGIRFVAVSSWLADKGRRSSLLGAEDLRVIPNAFPIEEFPARITPFEEIADNISEDKTGNITENISKNGSGDINILFGAARLDDPIKGWPVLMESLETLRDKHPEIARRLRLTLFGDIRDRSLLDRIPISHDWLGRVNPGQLSAIYRNGDIVLSTSDYETLPGTLIEGQASGCIPVAFDSGGQRDIIEHLSTGYLAEKTPDIRESARNIAAGILWAVSMTEGDIGSVRNRMRRSVEERFAEDAVARRYTDLFHELLKR